jgi:DNA-binding MarR family transcriptional regulator
MSESPLTATEFFVLVLSNIRDSTTMYELELRAGLSSGGVKHVVSSLERSGWIRRQPSGIRRRRVLVTTEQGRALITSKLAEILAAAEFGGFTSIVRVAWSALQLDRDEGLLFLQRAANRRDQYAQEQEAEQARLSQRDAVMHSYQRTALACFTERLRCEAKILRALAADPDAIALMHSNQDN